VSAEPHAPAEWDEDLLWQAERSHRLAREFCTCEGAYHRFWGWVRVSRQNDIIEREEPLLASMMLPFLHEGARVMIGGSADPGILCAVGRIYAPRRPSLMVIDKCKAPLALIEEYAAEKRLACRTRQLDLLDLAGGEQWDQIVLHYTLDFVEPHGRARLLGNLAACLAPQGTLICTAMSGARSSHAQRLEMERAYFDHLSAALANSTSSAHARDPDFEQQLRAYAAARTKRRLNSPAMEEVYGYLKDAGLQIVSEHRSTRKLAGWSVADTRLTIVVRRA
jgi:hypothetical protein